MSCQLLPEWHPQDAVLLAWPHADTDWQATLDAIHRVYVDLIKQISRFQHIVLVVHNASVHTSARQMLLSHHIDIQRILFVEAAYNDTWLRDTGPISCQHQEHIELHDFRFNGWGGKFDARLDDLLCQQLFKQSIFSAQHKCHDIYLEGGSIDNDGAGTLLTTSRCLLTSTRNPAMNMVDYATLFAQTFQIERVLWINHGELLGDDTDSHIDMLARFCDQQTIAYSACDDASDVHFASLSNLENELQGLLQADGTPYRLVPLPLPTAKYNQDGHRLPASYANFLIINQAVLVPVYADAMDEVACRRLADCFPDREIIPIEANAIIQQGGSLHCLTMQLPTGSLQLDTKI